MRPVFPLNVVSDFEYAERDMTGRFVAITIPLYGCAPLAPVGRIAFHRSREQWLLLVDALFVPFHAGDTHRFREIEFATDFVDAVVVVVGDHFTLTKYFLGKSDSEL